MIKFISGALASLTLLSAVITPSFAQEAVSGPDARAEANAKLPWLYENSDVPVDKSWTFGVLPNGLKYAVKQNNVPAGQVAIRVRIDAGSLYEKESIFLFADRNMFPMVNRKGYGRDLV